ncbi:MAG TPA: Do family serine endopeptidase [Verrucomicrobiota bacterium]|nr:Do family serine endopeptidase [Verrucomicrobiota bacterium]
MNTGIGFVSLVNRNRVAALVVAAGIVCVSMGSAAGADAPPKINVSDRPIDRDAKLPASFAPIVKKVAPSVVNIYSTRKVSVQRFWHPFMDDPTFRRFFGDENDNSRSRQSRSRKLESLGSGVIVSDDGYILSNAHVVDGADEIKVALPNDKTEYTAVLVGADPQTDIAVLKIEARKLTPITFADSDKLEVGDIALAIGNPFNVGQTVTKGMISALGRGGLGLVDYEDFIQTDAPINPGNSGGALVDIEGRLVGINQSIASRTGGNDGIGFAVPANIARNVMLNLVTDGSLSRGYLGVNIQPVTPDLAAAFNLPNQGGVLIGGVQPNTPAADAGIQPGDVIVAFNGKNVADPRQLRVFVSQTAPGSKAPVKFIRDGKEKTVNVTVAVLPGQFNMATRRTNERVPEVAAKILEGIALADADSNTRKQFEIPPDVNGAVVVGIAPDSPASESDLKPGDVIIEINHQPVAGRVEMMSAIGKSKSEQLLLRVWSNTGGMNGTRFVVLKPETTK